MMRASVKRIHETQNERRSRLLSDQQLVRISLLSISRKLSVWFDSGARRNVARSQIKFGVWRWKQTRTKWTSKRRQQKLWIPRIKINWCSRSLCKRRPVISRNSGRWFRFRKDSASFWYRLKVISAQWPVNCHIFIGYALRKNAGLLGGRGTGWNIPVWASRWIFRYFPVTAGLLRTGLCSNEKSRFLRFGYDDVSGASSIRLRSRV